MSLTAALPWEREEAGPLAGRVAAEAARAVVQGQLPPGSLITEADLAATHGVSRTPAREAMVQLEAWGLVRLMPKKGALVTAVTAAERRDLLAVRAMFEIDAVRLVTDSAAALGLIADPLRDRLVRQQRALADDDLMAFAAADHGFHAALILAGGNAVVASLLDGLAPRLARLTHQVCRERPELMPRLLREHERLAELAGAGDIGAFATAARAHIHDTHFPGGAEL